MLTAAAWRDAAVLARVFGVLRVATSTRERNLYIRAAAGYQMKRAMPQHGRGADVTRFEEWVQLAESAVLTLLEQELAVGHPELEARLSERGVPYGGRSLHLDPHILTEAVRRLELLGLITEAEHRTKGGRTVKLHVVADQRQRATYVQRAVRRKGMLHARLRTLTDQAGPAGEQVVRHSLQIAGRHLIPVAPDFGEVRETMGVRFYGPLDTAAWLHRVDAASGVPLQPAAVPIEVKNRRLTLYPIHKEVHQLLSKAATLQLAQPSFPIVPVLICRRAHPRLFWMAKDLGFRVHATNRQFTMLPKAMTPRLFDQVKNELQLTDLTALYPDRPLPTIQEFFQRTLPKVATDAANRWALTAPVVATYADELRLADVTPAERYDLVRDLRRDLTDELTDRGALAPGEELASWSLPELDE